MMQKKRKNEQTWGCDFGSFLTTSSLSHCVLPCRRHSHNALPHCIASFVQCKLGTLCMQCLNQAFRFWDTLRILLPFFFYNLWLIYLLSYGSANIIINYTKAENNWRERKRKQLCGPNKSVCSIWKVFNECRRPAWNVWQREGKARAGLHSGWRVASGTTTN